MRKRLRDLPDMTTTYPTPHDHRLYGRGHGERVAKTIEMTNALLKWAEVRSVADLSCGNGAIVAGLQPQPATVILGDYAPGYPITGPIERTIHEIQDVGLFVCSETLEHLDDPEAVLRDIRAKCAFLVVSTPLECWDDSNAEHVWAWGGWDVTDMLDDAGFGIYQFATVDSTVYGEPYCYGIWTCT